MNFQSRRDLAGAEDPMPPGRDFELCIHVGHIKTATTWLQETVFGNPESGFVVPWDSTRARAVAAFVSVNSYRDDRRWARGFFEEGLRSVTGDPRIPILSEEVLSGDPVQRRYDGRYIADRIHDAFPNARILIGVREQQSMVLSTYREYIWGGGVLPLEVYIGRGDEPMGITPIMQPDYLEYDNIVGYYHRLYGPENVLVMPFERLRSDPTGYIRAILDFCRCPGQVDRPAMPRRVGLSASALALHRMLNPVIRYNPLRPTFSRTHHFINRFAKLVDRMTPSRWSSAWEKRWRDTVERRYLGMFRESNRRLSQLTGIDFKALGYDA